MLQCTYGGQRTNFGSHFSPSIMCVLGFKLRLTGFWQALYSGPDNYLCMEANLCLFFHKKENGGLQITCRCTEHIKSVYVVHVHGHIHTHTSPDPSSFLSTFLLLILPHASWTHSCLFATYMPHLKSHTHTHAHTKA